MSEGLSQVLIRLFCCGLLCSIAMILSGSGPAREIVRICCAAVMMIALLLCFRMPLPQLLDTAEQYREEMQRSIDAALAAGEEERRALLQAEVAVRLRDECARLGADCEFSVLAATDGTYTVKKVEIHPLAPCTADLENSVIAMTAQQCGIARAEVIWREG